MATIALISPILEEQPQAWVGFPGQGTGSVQFIMSKESMVPGGTERKRLQKIKKRHEKLESFITSCTSTHFPFEDGTGDSTFSLAEGNTSSLGHYRVLYKVQSSTSLS